jgi:perosamine synthetase
MEPVAAYPNARSLVLRCLLFPLYPMLGKRDVEAVCRVLSTMP